jgi:hyperosmotically inducible periplasmic protein
MYSRIRPLNMVLCIGIALGSVCCLATAQTQNATPTPVTGSAATNTGINDRDKSGTSTTPTDQPNNSADIKLAASVRSAIVKDKSLSTLAHNVKLVASSGVVTLRGPVASVSEKAKVSERASQVAGVTSVDNELDVKAN